jgi:hypothetical protein
MWTLRETRGTDLIVVTVDAIAGVNHLVLKIDYCRSLIDVLPWWG